MRDRSTIHACNVTQFTALSIPAAISSLVPLATHRVGRRWSAGVPRRQPAPSSRPGNNPRAASAGCKLGNSDKTRARRVDRSRLASQGMGPQPQPPLQVNARSRYMPGTSRVPHSSQSIAPLYMLSGDTDWAKETSSIKCGLAGTKQSDQIAGDSSPGVDPSEADQVAQDSSRRVAAGRKRPRHSDCLPRESTRRAQIGLGRTP